MGGPYDLVFRRSNLDAELVEVGANDGADDEDCELEGPKHEAKVPDLQALAHGFARVKWSLKVRDHGEK